MLATYSLIRLVYFCGLSVSFLAAHEHDHRPYRPDTNPDMELMPLTRYRVLFTTSRPMTIRDPILLPEIPQEPPSGSEEYEDYSYESTDYGMSSSGHVHDHVELTTVETEEEYVYTDAAVSNAKNEYFMNDAPMSSSSSWITVASTILLLLLL